MRYPLWYRTVQAYQKKRSPPPRSLRLNSKAGNNRWRQTGRWKTRQCCLHPQHWSQQSGCQAKKFWPKEKLSQSLWIWIRASGLELVSNFKLPCPEREQSQTHLGTKLTHISDESSSFRRSSSLSFKPAVYNVKVEAFPDQRIQAGSANSTGKTIICVSTSSHTIAASMDLDKAKVSLRYVHGAWIDLWQPRAYSLNTTTGQLPPFYR